MVERAAARLGRATAKRNDCSYQGTVFTQVGRERASYDAPGPDRGAWAYGHPAHGSRREYEAPS